MRLMGVRLCRTGVCRQCDLVLIDIPGLEAKMETHSKNNEGHLTVIRMHPASSCQQLKCICQVVRALPDRLKEPTSQ